MKLPTFSSNALARNANFLRLPLGVAMVTLLAQTAFAAKIEGLATNVGGDELAKVPVCLALASSPLRCEKTRWTGKKGRYTFSGLQVGADYIVTVNGDSSAAVRKLEVYANYIWEPAKQTASVRSKSDSIVMQNVVGKFNFSNFQRALTLTAVDFPELASFTFSPSNYVFLKVFIPATQADAQPETIFLGQIQNPDNLAVEASLPLSATEIGYEIYDAQLSVSGTIALTAY
jgi:hypothetical protein